MNSLQPWAHSPSSRQPVAIPLFPLSTVLTPGAKLPLRVFEPRYVALLRAVLDPRTGTREFGVIGIKTGHEVGAGAGRALYDVGCTASVDHLAASGESQFALLTSGRRRFELVEVDASAGTPYLTGRVRFLDERVGDPERAAERLVRVRGELTRYLAAFGDEPVDLPEDPLAASYRITELARLGLADRADLLAAATAQDRLALAARILRREWTLVTRLGAVPWTGPPVGPV